MKNYDELAEKLERHAQLYPDPNVTLVATAAAAIKELIAERDSALAEIEYQSTWKRTANEQLSEVTKQRDEYLEERDAAIKDARYFEKHRDEVTKQRDSFIKALEEIHSGTSGEHPASVALKALASIPLHPGDANEMMKESK